MSTVVLETEPLAASVTVDNEELTEAIVDGRRISVPLPWYPRLLNASPAERESCNCWGTVTPLNSPTWARTSAWKEFWQGGPTAKAAAPSTAGSPSAKRSSK